MKKFNILQGEIQLIHHDEFYLGVNIPYPEIENHLKVMQKFLPQQDFQVYLSNQKLRDAHKHHITIVNPIEYNAEYCDVLVGNIITYSMVGLGRVTQDEDDVFFIVAESTDMEKLRQQVQLPKKDFHITLGFKNNDIHDVAKNRDTLTETLNLT
ncbi:hypothetical protein QUF74_13390 [Candidatus Halobeggiatoa sp. HSG11]|nr:hypothetical protein [Candidatus Halobeggiatoa sp. HSG11]